MFHPGCLHILSLAPEERDRFMEQLQGKQGEATRQAEIERLAAKYHERHPENKGIKKWFGFSCDQFK